MIASGAEIADYMWQQPGNILCLNDQTNIACFMFIKHVYHPIFQSLSPKIENISARNIQMIESLDDTHLL